MRELKTPGVPNEKFGFKKDEFQIEIMSTETSIWKVDSADFELLLSTEILEKMLESKLRVDANPGVC